MTPSLRRLLPLAGAMIALLPVAAHAEPYQPICAGAACTSGGLIWYNRSVGVKGSLTYSRQPNDGVHCGQVSFTFYLDEAGTILLNPMNNQHNPETRSTCKPERDFNFTEQGPQGGIRRVDVSVSDAGGGGTSGLRFVRSGDPSAGQNLPELPDFDTGA